MATLIADFDWSLTPLGPIEQWPQSLKTAVTLMLNARQPMWIGWGDAMTFLYNDAYIPVLSLAKHPQALGQPAAVVWQEIWDFCGPLADKVFQQGESSFVDDVQLFMDRGGMLEETFYSFSYSPIRGECGRVDGLFCPNVEVTAQNLNTRRLATLSALTANALGERTAQAACESIAQTLAQNTADIPFALLYLTQADNRSLRLEQAVHVTPAADWQQVTLDGLWTAPLGLPLAQVLEENKALTGHWAPTPELPMGPAGQAIRQAIVLPLVAPGQHHPLGVLVAAINPTRQLDTDYRTFYELMANQAAAAIQNARAAEEERQHLEQLAELNRAKTLFFSNISHEFRTPLTLMLGPLEELLRGTDGALSRAHQTHVQAAHRNARRLLRLVNTLLDFSRLEAGRLQANFALTDLATLTVDLASNFRSAVEKAGLQLIVDVGTLTGPVAVDPTMWEKIVLNLISNAFKFTLAGSITVRLRQLDDAVELSVQDTGVGIPEADLPRLFERFHRVEGSRGRSFEGTGIGLALVHELIDLHAGTIDVQSEVNVGSTFTVRLPMKQATLATTANGPLGSANLFVADAESTESTATEPSSKTATSQAITKRILLADDNADMRAYIHRLLSPHYAVDVVTDGQQALEAIRRHQPDLVLSDIMMPHLDGTQLLSIIKSDPQTAQMPVMLLSARAGEEATLDGYTAGADDYLTKPFSANELLTRVRAQINLAQNRQEQQLKLRHLFQQAPVAISTVEGPQHVFTFANDFYIQLVDRSRDQLIGRPFLDAFPELVEQGFGPQLDQILQTGKPFVITEGSVTVKRHGQLAEGYFNYSFHPFTDINGNTMGVIMAAQEVTDSVLARQQIEESEQRLERLVAERTMALNQLNADLERSNLDLMQFASVASHDLKEPLRKVEAFSNLLAMSLAGKLEKEEAQHFERIIRAVARMQSLVDDVLRFSKLSKQDAQFEPVDLTIVLSRILEDLDIRIQERNAQVRVDTLPVIQAIPGQMHQLFQNLISNALKFAGDRPPLIAIQNCPVTGTVRETFGLADSVSYVMLKVTDNGIGFSMKYADKIFGMFQRLNNKGDYPGTGIGLAICRRIVENHHGFIVADSQPNQGASFTILLPVEQ
ncbi:multi-sensor signal transduction histidine kinase [Fibrella aestuarina BUZ 2]|uniref:histidine kinase n=1 Tax=Fibrella aestuarina BUZ 2 TaxID=1166018 RepID=I0K544_9BACT|nr:ATP-binding protein [Fibrella aestuarina]CCG99247.1 multi-sensor signal transduction histidine kinase [Fibrella aestuarina BUZ 2]